MKRGLVIKIRFILLIIIILTISCMCIAPIASEHKTTRETSYALPIKYNSELLSSTQLGEVRTHKMGKLSHLCTDEVHGVHLVSYAHTISTLSQNKPKESSFQDCQANYNFCLSYNNCTNHDDRNYYCQNYCRETIRLTSPTCSSWKEIFSLNCPFFNSEENIRLTWTNKELTNPCTYSIRDLDLSDLGMITKGHFDWQNNFQTDLQNDLQTENNCNPPKEFFVYLPEGQHQQYQLFIIIHDSYGFAEDYLNFVLNNSGQFNKNFFDKEGIVILAPQFNFYSEDCSYRNFDLFMSNQNGGENHRSDQWLLFLIDYLQQKIPTLETGQFYLFGHSKGAQFLSAFTAAYPERVKKAIFSAGGFYVGEDFLEIDESKTDLKFNFSELLKNHPVNLIIGENDLDRRKCAAKKYICDTIKKYCDFDEKPFFDCEEVWNAPEKVLLINGSNYCSNFYQESCNLVDNPCSGKKPAVLGTAKCQFNFSWVKNGEHSAEKNYLAAGKELFLKVK